MQRLLFSLLLLTLLSACAKPIADFAYSADKKVAPAKVQFDNQSKDAESYVWDFGDGTTSTDASPTHIYKSSGNYAISLKATKGNKTTVSEKRIIVEQPIDCLVEIETDYGNMTILLYNSTPTAPRQFYQIGGTRLF